MSRIQDIIDELNREDADYITDLERIAATVAKSYPLRDTGDGTCRCFYCGAETTLAAGAQPPKPERFLHRVDCVWTLARGLQ